LLAHLLPLVAENEWPLYAREATSPHWKKDDCCGGMRPVRAAKAERRFCVQ